MIALHALAKVAGCLRPLSTAIQQVGLDVLKAVNDVIDVSGLLQKYRNDADCFTTLFQSAVVTANLLDITVNKPRTVGRSVYRDNAGEKDQSVEDYYRLNLFLPLVDSVCSHLQDRFGPVQQKLFGLSALVPAHLGSYNDVVAGASLYEYLITVHELPTEFELWTEQWTRAGEAERKKVNTAVLALECCLQRFVKLPNVSVLLKILATLPVTTAQAERVFSKVERTASAARSSMLEERLESLVLIQTHRDRTLSIDDIINRFAKSSERRFIL